jgi:DNA polymerase elongation subunit (family B)
VAGCTEQEFGDFVKHCNEDLYPRILKAQGCVVNRVKLAYEKCFERIVFTSAKRYAGVYLHYKGTRSTADSKPEVKGLEYKRGDSCRLARELQSSAVDLICKDKVEDPIVLKSLVAEIRERALRGNVELSEIVLSKGMQKEPGMYLKCATCEHFEAEHRGGVKKSCSQRKCNCREYQPIRKKNGDPEAAPEHVRAAKVLEARGRDVSEGTKISYFVVDGTTSPKTVAPAEDFNGEFDRYHLWESLVWPPTERLLAKAFPDHDWSEFDRARPKKNKGAKAGQTSLWGII